MIGKMIGEIRRVNDRRNRKYFDFISFLGKEANSAKCDQC